MILRAVFFDMGGVILRTEYQAPREALAERLNLTYEDLYKIVFESETSRKASVGQISIDEHWAAVTRKLGRPIGEATRIRQDFFAGDILDRELLDYIRTLRPKYKTGLITNGWPDVRGFLQKNKLDERFAVMLVSAEVG